MISRVEFNQLCADERSKQAFLDLDVDIENFESMTGFLFDPDEPGEPDKELPFADMLKRVLMMRATQNARVFDVMEVSKHSTRQSQLLVDKSSAAEKAAKELPMAPSRHPTQKFVGASDITARVQRFEESFENRIDGIETAVRSLVRMLRVNCLGLRVLRVHLLTHSREFTHKRIYAYSGELREISNFVENPTIFQPHLADFCQSVAKFAKF